APHPERGVRRLGVVVVDPAAELGQDRLRIPQLGVVHVVALEGPAECLGQTAVEEEDTKNRGVAEIKTDVPPARIVHGTEMLLDSADEAPRKSDAPVKRRSRRFGGWPLI